MKATTTNKINRQYQQTLSKAAVMPAVVKCGEMLTEAKQQAKRGEWTTWLKDGFDGSQRTANDYMRLSAAELAEGWESMSIRQCLASLKPTRTREAPSAKQSSQPKRLWDHVGDVQQDAERLLRLIPYRTKDEDTGISRLMTWEERKAAMLKAWHTWKEGTSVWGNATGEEHPQTLGIDAGRTTKVVNHTENGSTFSVTEQWAPRSGFGEHPDWAEKGFRITVTIEAIE